MIPNKIVGNILHALAASNSGLVFFCEKKPTLALHYMIKAKGLLGKGCTGIQDKDLQLFLTNFSRYLQFLNYNIALLTLHTRSGEYWEHFTTARKFKDSSISFKFWYRNGQSLLMQYNHYQNYPQGEDRVSVGFKDKILREAYRSFRKSLLYLKKVSRLTSDTYYHLKYYIQQLNQEDYEEIMRNYNLDLTNF